MTRPLLLLALQAHHGQFVCVEPDGRVVANRDGLGPWEQFTVDILSASIKQSNGMDAVTATLKSHHGKYLCAELDGTVVANRDDVGPWEQWTLLRTPDGGVALKSHHGKYLCAEGGGGDIVVANREGLGVWEMFEDHWLDAADPLDHPALGRQGRVPAGILRLEGRGYLDDHGPFLGGTASFFHATRTYRQNPAKYLEDALAIRALGADSARIITDLGWPQTGLGIDRSQNGPAHLHDLAAVIDHLWSIGVRTHVTLFGSLFGARIRSTGEWEKLFPYHLDTQRKRLDYAAAVCDLVNASRTEKIWGVEICNEPENYWVGPLSRDDQAELRAFVKARLPHNLVTLGAPGGQQGATTWGDDDYAWYAQHGDMVLPHLDRGYRDNGFGHIHQGIISAQKPYPWKHNEPIGPRSSVAEERNPDRLRMAATATWVCRGADYCWHTFSGIGLAGDSDYPLAQEPGFPDVFKMRAVLPPDLPNFQFHNWHWSSNPLESLERPPTDADGHQNRGAVRTLACTSGDRRVFQVIGVALRGVRWRPRESMRLTIYQNGALLDDVTVSRGVEFSLPQADEYVMVGTRI